MSYDDLKIIKRRDGLVPIEFKELFRYRELFWFMALKAIMVRYKQAVLGIAWAIIQPIFTMIVFSVIFGNLAKLPSDGLPYPIMVYTALLPWQFFATSVSSSSRSVVSNTGVIQKVYFPRLIIPVSAIISRLVDFFVSFIVLIGMMAWYRIVPTGNIVFLPVFLLLAFFSALAIGLWTSALNVEFRDVIYILPFIIQAGQYISPVAYSSSIIPKKYIFLYSLNPMAGVIEGFRWCLLGSNPPNWQSIMIGFILVFIILVGGLFYFRKMEKTFADVI